MYFRVENSHVLKLVSDIFISFDVGECVKRHYLIEQNISALSVDFDKSVVVVCLSVFHLSLMDHLYQ